MDNKNIKNEVIDEIVDIESNWYSVFKEFLIFSGVTFLLYCNYFFTTVLSSMFYFRSTAKSKIQDEMDNQLAAIDRYNYAHNLKKSPSEIVLPTETQMLQYDLKNNEHALIIFSVITAVAFGLMYTFYTQLNLRSKIRIPTTIASMLVVTVYFFYKELDVLMNEGESLLFIINCLIPFITSFFLSLFVLLTPKNGRFSYYN